MFSKSDVKDSKTEKIIFTIQGMHCVACSMNIDGELEDTPGVISSTTSYAKATSEVEYDPSKVSIQQMQTIVKTLGYEITPQLQ